MFGKLLVCILKLILHRHFGLYFNINKLLESTTTPSSLADKSVFVFFGCVLEFQYRRVAGSQILKRKSFRSMVGFDSNNDQPVAPGQAFCRPLLEFCCL